MKLVKDQFDGAYPFCKLVLQSRVLLRLSPPHENATVCMDGVGEKQQVSYNSDRM